MSTSAADPIVDHGITSHTMHIPVTFNSNNDVERVEIKTADIAAKLGVAHPELANINKITIGTPIVPHVDPDDITMGVKLLTGTKDNMTSLAPHSLESQVNPRDKSWVDSHLVHYGGQKTTKDIDFPSPTLEEDDIHPALDHFGQYSYVDRTLLDDGTHSVDFKMYPADSHKLGYKEIGKGDQRKAYVPSEVNGNRNPIARHIENEGIDAEKHTINGINGYALSIEDVQDIVKGLPAKLEYHDPLAKSDHLYVEVNRFGERDLRNATIPITFHRTPHGDDGKPLSYGGVKDLLDVSHVAENEVHNDGYNKLFGDGDNDDDEPVEVRDVNTSDD